MVGRLRCCLRLRLEKRLHLSKVKSEFSLCIRFARSLKYCYNEDNAVFRLNTLFILVEFSEGSEDFAHFNSDSGGQRTATTCPVVTIRQFF